MPNISRIPSFIVNPIFPTRELHLIAGGSGSGKSTLASQLAQMFLKGDEIFGFPANPIKGIGYIAFDRSIDGMRRTFERSLQTTEIPFPYYSTVNSPQFDKPTYRTGLGALEHLHELHPEIDVILADGLGMSFKGDSSKLSEVTDFVQNIIRWISALDSDLTIFALHHMGKQKKGNEYAQARQRIHGSVAWGGTAETCILIEPEEEEDAENPNRIITVCPRNASERRYTYTFDEFGRLVPGNELIDPKKESKRDKFQQMILAIAEETEIPYDSLKESALALGIPIATLTRWLEKAVGEGLLVRVGGGLYKRAKPQ